MCKREALPAWAVGLIERDPVGATRTLYLSELALVATLWAHRLAKGRSLRALCRERGWTPQTFHTRKTKALAAIAAALETRGEPVF